MHRRSFLKALSGAVVCGVQPAEASLGQLSASLNQGFQLEPGIQTGFRELDGMLQGGFRRGSLNVLSARPSMGKSVLAQQIIGHVGVHCRLPVLLFSLEMDKDEATLRLLAARAGVTPRALRQAELNNAELARVTDALQRLESAPVFIHDTVFSPDQIFSQAEGLCRKTGAPGLVVVDYLQCLHDAGKHDANTLAQRLKELAQRLNAPVLVLSQLHRRLENRKDKRPALFDLPHRAIGSHADLVLFLYRDDYYDTGTATPGVAEVIIGKNRHGPAGMLSLSCRGNNFGFQDFEAACADRPD